MTSQCYAALDAGQLCRALRRGESSPTAVVDACLERIATCDDELHCLTDVFADEARQRARQLEAAPPRGALWGVPWLIKDNMATRLGRTTCGSQLLGSFRSPYDAHVAERLEDAGAILLGKTNLDEFSMGSSTENSAWGETRNPWSPEHVPGGSSGGSAAAVAAGYAGFALGSDTGGSIRQPAAFCGVVGMKPTYGRVSRYGLVAFASSLDQIGPLARNVDSTAAVLRVIAAHDPRDATSSTDAALQPEPDADASPAPPPRIGVPRHFVGEGVDPVVRANFDATLQRLADAGAQVLDVELPHAAYAVAAYYVIATAEAASNLSRYDGVRYTQRAGGATDVAALMEESRTAGFGAEVQRRILLGTFVLSSGYYDAYYKRAQQARTLVCGDFDTALAHCDVIAMPTSPTPPFRLGERTDDPLQMYLSDVFTVPANLYGGPAISLPTGTADGLPLGMQLYAAPMRDAALLDAAAWVERQVDFDPGGANAAGT